MRGVVTTDVCLYLCGGEQSISEIPLGIGYLLTNCQVPGVALRYVKVREDLAGADVIGLSSNAWGLREAVSILHEHQCMPVVIGGQGTLWPGLADYPFAHIIQGEGEDAFRYWLTHRQSGTSHFIPCPVDYLNPPDRGVCGATVPILTSRGCPWLCAFCSSKAFWGGVRYHSPEYVMSEVEGILRDYPHTQHLYLMDDTFAASASRLESLAEPWFARGFDKRLSLHGFIRATVFDRPMADLMKRMGFLSVRFGAESGSDRILSLLNKQATVADNERAIRIANEASLPVSFSVMRGIPGETEEDRNATRGFIARMEGRATVEGNYEYRPFPGSPMWLGENPLEVDMRVRG